MTDTGFSGKFNFSVTLNLFQGLLCRSSEGRKAGGQAVICGHSPHKEACHCEGVKRLLQSQNSEVLSIIKPHPTPLLVKEREYNSPKRTYSPIDLLTYSLKKKSAFTLAEGATRVAPPNSKRRAAFTLTEILITLGIIGVVAALTIPTIINKYQKQLAVSRLKTAYGILSNALILAQKDYGEYTYWTYYQQDKGAAQSSFEFANKYLKPYIKNVAIYSDNKIIGCKNITYKFMDGSVANCDTVVSFCSTCTTINTSQLHLANGMIIAVLTRPSPTDENLQKAEFHIDTNGLKGPNVWGKDIFRFGLVSLQDKMKLCGGDCHDRSFDLAHHCTMDYAYGCAEVIISDSWQIKDDYPWR